MDDREKFLTEVLYPVARVRAGRSGGSGTVVFSQMNHGEYETYIVTNWHVVSSLIKVRTRYNSFLQRDMPEETRGIATVDFFRYFNGSHVDATYTMRAKIVAYNEEEDLALLKLESKVKADFVAKLPPREREHGVQLADQVFAVGSAMGHAPVITSGMLNFLDEQIDDHDFWLCSAPIIFGNSGGAIFSAKNHEFIGIPSRIEIAQAGWVMSPVTHLGFAIPFTRLYDWLDAEFYQFIYDSEYTIDECREERDKAREELQRMEDILNISKNKN